MFAASAIASRGKRGPAFARLSTLGLAGLTTTVLLGGCTDGEPDAEVPPPVSSDPVIDMEIDDIAPGTLVPGSTLVIGGRNFVPDFAGPTTLTLEGEVDGVRASLALPARFVDYERLEVTWSGDGMGGRREGTFRGQAALEAESDLDARWHRSIPAPLTLRFAPHLTPRVDGLEGNVAFVNDRITVRGDDFLLGRDEGVTVALVEGCFRPSDGTVCTPVGPTTIAAPAVEATDRTTVTFPFSPAIAGIAPGTFEGSVAVRNQHPDGTTLGPDPQPLVATIAPPVIAGLSTPSASLGQYVDIDGRGFVGPRDGDPLAVTTVVLTGTFTPDGGGSPFDTDLTLVSEFVGGNRVRYVLNEEDELGQAIDLRTITGRYAGTATPTVTDGAATVVGTSIDVSLEIAPVRQVVWLRYRPTYTESLRRFGLRAADRAIRQRVREVVERDYGGVNVVLREARPEDYALYSEVELSGPDPNGIGLLGYDNTPGKDVGNLRLYDRLGGVNALTQSDGFPGYGGVFIESLFVFSEDPGALSVAAGRGHPLFDRIFDPFRPDRDGTPATREEVDAAPPPLTSGAGCPTVSADRPGQLACAVWTLGNLIGGTLSHEIAHSLGLADPHGEAFHNLTDKQGALMDRGAERPFVERAELDGAAPAVFCTQNYAYLQGILPTGLPDPRPDRVSCF
ncbi:MAG: hypothetical protein AAF928_01090 [Myxococcota bacterium]